MSDVSAVLRDTERLAALRRLVLVDTPPTEPFDRLTRMAARLLRAPVALLTLVDADRQWFKSHHGLTDLVATSRHSPLSYSLCQFAVASGEPLVVEDAAAHPQFQDHAIVRDYGVRAYAGSPLFSPDGYPVGALCVLDLEPRHWTDADLANLNDLAALAMREMLLHVHERRARRRVKYR